MVSEDFPFLSSLFLFTFKTTAGVFEGLARYSPLESNFFWQDTWSRPSSILTTLSLSPCQAGPFEFIQLLRSKLKPLRGQMIDVRQHAAAFYPKRTRSIIAGHTLVRAEGKHLSIAGAASSRASHSSFGSCEISDGSGWVAISTRNSTVLRELSVGKREASTSARPSHFSFLSIGGLRTGLIVTGTLVLRRRR